MGSSGSSRNSSAKAASSSGGRLGQLELQLAQPQIIGPMPQRLLEDPPRFLLLILALAVLLDQVVGGDGVAGIGDKVFLDGGGVGRVEPGFQRQPDAVGLEDILVELAESVEIGGIHRVPVSMRVWNSSSSFRGEAGSAFTFRSNVPHFDFTDLSRGVSSKRRT